MALGARCFKEGRVYNSLGSSSWISVSSGQPLLNSHSHPYVFAHVLPDQFISSVSVFSAGTSFRWVRDQLCPDLSAAAQAAQADPYDWMTRLAAQAEPGCRGSAVQPQPGRRFLARSQPRSARGVYWPRFEPYAGGVDPRGDGGCGVRIAYRSG